MTEIAAAAESLSLGQKIELCIAALPSQFRPNPANYSDPMDGLLHGIRKLTHERDEQRKVLDAIYDYASNTIRTASRDVGDWVDSMEHVGLLAAEED